MLTMGQAAKEAGVSKSTLSRAVKNGKVSATKNAKGGYDIDPAELFRVYPRNTATASGNGFKIKAPDEAIKWFRKAADKGHIDAMVSLAEMYAQGKEVSKDDVEATNFYRQAADKGNDTAKLILADRLLEGSGTQRDVTGAIRIYTELDNDKSRNKLGDIYRSGNGVELSYSTAMEWYKKADSDWVATINLAEMHDKGEGVKKNSKKAAALIVNHAKNNFYLYGDALAFFNKRNKKFSVSTRQRIQRLLKKAGHYSGAIDGALGPKTIKAFEALFNANNS